MTLEELKEIANVFQALAVGVAVLAGGGWALFRYFSLRSIQSAKANLEKTLVELEGARRGLLERGIIDINLKTEQIYSGDNYLICVEATLTNKGSSTEIIVWSKGSMSAEKVICKSDGGIELSGNIISGYRLGKTKETVLLPSETANPSFIICVPDSGIYHLEFKACCSVMQTQTIVKELEKARFKVEEINEFCCKYAVKKQGDANNG